jgi:hypothetical protein
MTKEEREIRAILARARKIMPASEASPLYLGLGSIVANAEDLLDELEAERRMANLRSVLG